MNILALLHRPAALRRRAVHPHLPGRPDRAAAPADLRYRVPPPQVVVRAQFPGANLRHRRDRLPTPLEEQINGVENMYMNSQASADGAMTLTVSFKIGTDPEVAATEVQNRVNRALPRLPDVVRQIG